MQQDQEQEHNQQQQQHKQQHKQHDQEQRVLELKEQHEHVQGKTPKPRCQRHQARH